MNNRQSAADEAFEMLLKESAGLAAEEIGKSYEEPPEYEPSPEFDERLEKLFARERRKKRLRRMASISKRAACVLLVLAVACSVAIGSVEAWRIKLLNFIFDPDKPNMDIVFGDKGIHYADEDISIDYLPLGFSLTEKASTRKNMTFTFELEDKYIRVTRFNIELSPNIDTEGATVEDVVINGNDGVYVEKEGFKAVVWSNGNYIFMITANVSENELLRVAENIK